MGLYVYERHLAEQLEHLDVMGKIAGSNPILAKTGKLNCSPCSEWVPELCWGRFRRQERLGTALNMP